MLLPSRPGPRRSSSRRPHVRGRDGRRRRSATARRPAHARRRPPRPAAAAAAVVAAAVAAAAADRRKAQGQDRPARRRLGQDRPAGARPLQHAPARSASRHARAARASAAPPPSSPRRARSSSASASRTWRAAGEGHHHRPRAQHEWPQGRGRQEAQDDPPLGICVRSFLPLGLILGLLAIVALASGREASAKPSQVGYGTPTATPAATSTRHGQATATATATARRRPTRRRCCGAVRRRRLTVTPKVKISLLGGGSVRWASRSDVSLQHRGQGPPAGSSRRPGRRRHLREVQRSGQEAQAHPLQEHRRAAGQGDDQGPGAQQRRCQGEARHQVEEPSDTEPGCEKK